MPMQPKRPSRRGNSGESLSTPGKTTSYDLFISYSRRDNAQGRITQLVERIKIDFAPFAKRELVPFFDQQEIHGMQDWRQRILQGLRESRLLLACLSPA